MSDYSFDFPIPSVPPIASARFKVVPEDFVVTEHLDTQFSEQGEHLYLFVEKKETNTAALAKQLAKWAEIPVRDVGYSGLKDRFAITRQWFSLRLPKKKSPTTPFDSTTATILQQHWHQKKLNRGNHQANEFCITLRITSAIHHELVNKKLAQIATDGVPNYFGSQRFGRLGNNLEQFLQYVNRERRFKRHETSLLISAARSYLFNCILAARVTDGTWNHPVLGDCFNLAGSNSYFCPTQAEFHQQLDDLVRRIKDFDIHPTGVLWGSGELNSHSQVADIEHGVASRYSELVEGLASLQLKAAQRPLRMQPEALKWQWLPDEDNPDATVLQLTFLLNTGSYATTVLTNLVHQLD